MNKQNASFGSYYLEAHVSNCFMESSNVKIHGVAHACFTYDICSLQEWLYAEMAQQLRALTAPAEGPVSIPSISETSVIPVPGHLPPSSGLYGHCMRIMHIHASKTLMHIK